MVAPSGSLVLAGPVMSKACLRQSLFGQSLSSDHLAGSDHYGVINTYSYHMLC